MSNELQAINQNARVALWANRVSECRSSGLSVKVWCEENGVNLHTYYKWQKRLFGMAQEQRQAQFTEILSSQRSTGIAITIRIRDIEANVHNGADTTIVESILRILSHAE